MVLLAIKCKGLSADKEKVLGEGRKVHSIPPIATVLPRVVSTDHPRFSATVGDAADKGRPEVEWGEKQESLRGRLCEPRERVKSLCQGEEEESVAGRRRRRGDRRLRLVHVPPPSYFLPNCRNHVEVDLMILAMCRWFL